MTRSLILLVLWTVTGFFAKSQFVDRCYTPSGDLAEEWGSCAAPYIKGGILIFGNAFGYYADGYSRPFMMPLWPGDEPGAATIFEPDTPDVALAMSTWQEVDHDAAWGYTLCGFGEDTAHHRRGVVVRLDHLGNELWRRYVSDPTYSVQLIQSQFTPDGGCITVGLIENWNPYRTLVIRHDPTGTELWRRVFNNGSSGAVEVLDDGGCVMAGLTGASNGSHAWYARLDPDGNEVWNHTLPMGEQHVWINSIVRTSGESFVLVGGIDTLLFPNLNYPQGTMEVVRNVFASIDATGEVQWLTRAPHLGVAAHFAPRGVALPDGRLTFCGHGIDTLFWGVDSLMASDFAGYVVQLSPSGEIIWSTDVHHWIEPGVPAFFSDLTGIFVDPEQERLLMVGRAKGLPVQQQWATGSDVWLCGIDFNGCTLPECEQELEQTTAPALQLFPNPVSDGHVTIATDQPGSGEVCDIEVFAWDGRRVQFRNGVQWTGQYVGLELDNLASGIYTVVVRSGGETMNALLSVY